MVQVTALFIYDDGNVLGEPTHAGALKLEDLLTLSSDLDAHAIDFGTDVI